VEELREREDRQIRVFSAALDYAATTSENLTFINQEIIKNNYSKANPYIENYLLNVGRRKFLKPLYEAFAKTPEGMKTGLAIFKKAEGSYHAVSRNSIKEILHLGTELE
jgi:hypothetical protein